MAFNPRLYSCPYTGMTKSCFEARIERDCPKWIGVEMTDPQNPTARIAEETCADRLVPMQLMALNNNLVERFMGLQQAVETRGTAQAEQQARVATVLERAASRRAIEDMSGAGD